MTAVAAYSALHHLHSVLLIPPVADAWFGKLEVRHKSFRDYLMDFERSGMFLNFENESLELYMRCAARIFNEVSNGLSLSPYYSPPSSPKICS
jgi:hypothetical protein